MVSSGHRKQTVAAGGDRQLADVARPGNASKSGALHACVRGEDSEHKVSLPHAALQLLSRDAKTAAP
jgi:hypothetical protein